MSSVTSIPTPKPPEKPAVAPAPAASPVVSPGGTDAVEAAATATARSARRTRVVRMLTGLALWVLLPTAIAAVYYGFIVPDQYESTSVLMLNGNDSEAARRGVLLTEYLVSRDALGVLEQETKFSTYFMNAHDPVGLSRSAGSEALFGSFLQNTSVRHESRSAIVRLRVRAYDGASAQRFARALVDAGDHFLARVDKSERGGFVVVSAPSAPNEPTYPRRGYNVLTAFLAALALFSIGSLLLAAMREHAHF